MQLQLRELRQKAIEDLYTHLRDQACCDKHKRVRYSGHGYGDSRCPRLPQRRSEAAGAYFEFHQQIAAAVAVARHIAALALLVYVLLALIVVYYLAIT